MGHQASTLWEISSRTLPTVVVAAPNWMAAVGLAMDRHRLSDGMERVACECLPNGIIILNDITTGRRLTIRRCQSDPKPTPEQPLMDWMLDCVMGQAA